ncbi:hypothetical protein R3P38DRAFT_1052309 [Favolaschia claudopus]|uniref:Uncharacterized protein n=1 Tax=Favolaschia claudopus TaxID=2862362 RepID=A0AAW0BFC4_9AGAR
MAEVNMPFNLDPLVASLPPTNSVGSGKERNADPSSIPPQHRRKISPLHARKPEDPARFHPGYPQDTGADANTSESPGEMHFTVAQGGIRAHAMNFIRLRQEMSQQVEEEKVSESE